MRFWIPVFALLGLFLLAAFWQSRFRADLRSEQVRRWAHEAGPDPLVAGMSGSGDPRSSARAAPRSDWSHLRVGRPSGAEPWRALEGVPGAAAEAQRSDAAPELRHHTVAPGESLSRICERHYGSARPSLVRSVAGYNGLADPDALVAGRRLALPPLDVLVDR